MSIVPRLEPYDTTPPTCVTVERAALHDLLLEVHDLRARQGVDWRWMDTLPPRLQAECSLAFEVAS